MSVMHRFRWVLTIAIVAVCAVTVVAGAAVTDVRRFADPPPTKAPRVSPGGPLLELTNLEPGDVRSASFTVENPNAVPTLSRIAGRLTSGSQALYGNLVAEILKSDTGVFWRGTLAQLSGDTSALSTVAAGAQVPMTLRISVPPGLGNDFQSLTSRFDLEFSLVRADFAYNDRIAPGSRLMSIKPGRKRLKMTISIRKLRKKRVKIYGRAVDAQSGIARVEVALMKVGNRGRRERFCRSWNPAKNKFMYVGGRTNSCKRMVWFNAIGAERFRFVLKPKMTKRGKYILRTRAIDKANNYETKLSPRKRNVFRFRIR